MWSTSFLSASFCLFCFCDLLYALFISLNKEYDQYVIAPGGGGGGGGGGGLKIWLPTPL